MGVAILKETGNGFTDEYTITLQHHENYDGTGYPHGLQKEDIHRCGKIARIIDVYDALTTEQTVCKRSKAICRSCGDEGKDVSTVLTGNCLKSLYAFQDLTISVKGKGRVTSYIAKSGVALSEFKYNMYF